MKSSLALALMLAIGEMNIKESRTTEKIKTINKKKPKTLPNGVKEFEINGHKIYSINKKNAIRKAKNKGIL